MLLDEFDREKDSLVFQAWINNLKSMEGFDPLTLVKELKKWRSESEYTYKLSRETLRKFKEYGEFPTNALQRSGMFQLWNLLREKYIYFFPARQKEVTPKYRKSTTTIADETNNRWSGPCK